MQPTKMDVLREVQSGSGAHGEFLLGDAREKLVDLLDRYRGQVQLIYLDPPFATGQQWKIRMRAGEKDWKSGNGSIQLPAYSDPSSEPEYLQMMREVLTGCRELLSDTGVLFLHIDFRMHARLRLLMDEIFGEACFLNEIIWAYQTGGRARRYFSRKHDVILFYRKTKNYTFDITQVPVERAGNRRNHMKRHVDTDGRVYRSIRSGGKVYTYYDDEPAYPGDVWDDVSHLQQKDPQRTGYDTQKPISLLTRIVQCASKPGDLVMDLFSGSGTTLEAAHLCGRRFVGVDMSPMSMHVIRRRLMDADVLYQAPPFDGEPLVAAQMQSGIAYYDITMLKYELEPGLTARSFTGMDALDSWSAGYLRDGAFVSMVSSFRTKQQPQLQTLLQLPVLSGIPMIRTQDVLGRAFFFALQ
ncbi:site-specific DNA-methyltransferase [Eubacteriales bacterium OttesenSCG-928-N13]|nr:site-specific DNA-methyltransferase [Eubacteriales bacterium OttesenSCG-928-N13]